MNISARVLFLCLPATMCFGQTADQQFIADYGDLKINEIQVLGTHNSYTQPVDPKVLSAGSATFSKIFGSFEQNMTAEEKATFEEFHPNGMSLEEGGQYQHPLFPEQLDAGMRSLEIDVYYDPEGDRFSDPAAYRFMKQKGITDLAPFSSEGLDEPGYKVLHIPDFDFRTHYPTLKKALLALKAWSDKNPQHIPIYILLEAKDSAIPLFPDATTVLKLDDEAFDALDAEVVSVLGRDKIITPDDVRGDHATLREAVTSKQWPTVNESRGKFIFLLLPGSGGAVASQKSPYVAHHPSLRGRVMFAQSSPDSEHAAFLLLDNAIVRQEEIQRYVQQGYLVRARADIETYEAKVNDPTRADAAFSSGAQVVSTDFYQPGNAYGTDYYVQMPGGSVARCNPVNGADNCKDSEQRFQ
jgi:hypothetical protein